MTTKDSKEADAEILSWAGWRGLSSTRARPRSDERLAKRVSGS